MGLDPRQFRIYVIDPVLRQLGLYSPAASNLLLGTALTESGGLVYLHQLDNGPALGIYQCELSTYDDITANYLPYHPELYSKILNMKCAGLTAAENLTCNMAFATCICRAHYLRVTEPLPDPTNAHDLAQYYKVYYNTSLGAATVEGATPRFQTAIDTPYN